MNAARSFNHLAFGLPAGAWRWAALGFVVLALGSAGLAVVTPDRVGWAGYALLGGIGAVASLLLFAVWPRETMSIADAKRVAEAATRANVAWAITAADGAVLDCNPVYRRMAGAKEGESAPPPELALAGEPSSAVLYRLSRDAAEGRPREESFVVVPGLEIVAAVRPLADKQTAWWFTPRLAASGSPQPVLTPKSAAAPAAPAAAQAAPNVMAAAQAAPNVMAPAQAAAPQAAAEVTDLFRDAPMGVAFADAGGALSDANAAFAQFFGASLPLDARNVGELVDDGDRQAVLGLIAKAAAGAQDKHSVELRRRRQGG